jgi:hypothetical protein
MFAGFGVFNFFVRLIANSRGHRTSRAGDVPSDRRSKQLRTRGDVPISRDATCSARHPKRSSRRPSNNQDQEQLRRLPPDPMGAHRSQRLRPAAALAPGRPSHTPVADRHSRSIPIRRALIRPARHDTTSILSDLNSWQSPQGVRHFVFQHRLAKTETLSRFHYRNAAAPDLLSVFRRL